MNSDRSSAPHPALVGSRYVVLGILVNIGLALVKGLTGYVGNSQALVADAIESVLDVVSSLVVWGGLVIAARPPDENHPYGHGKAEPLAALAVSGTLCLTSFLVVYQSVLEILGTSDKPEAFTLPVLIGVIVIKEFLSRRVLKAGEGIDSVAVRLEAFHHRSDAMTSFAALLGISVALLGGKDFWIADDIAAVFAGFVILANAFRLIRPALNELTDVVPSESMEQEIRRVGATVPGALGIEKCFVRKMGFEYFVDLHLIVNGSISVRDGHTIAHNVKDRLRAENPRIYEVLVHVEPDEELSKLTTS